MTGINFDDPQRHMHNPIHTVHRTIVVLFFAALPALVTVVLLRQPAALAQPASGPKSGPTSTASWFPLYSRGKNAAERTSWASAAAAVGTPLPRIQCTHAYTAIVYAEGLSSPDGLAFSPIGVLHVAEEAAGRVSRIGPAGRATPVITGLVSPEGIAFDDTGNLYVVEDVPAGRLVKMTADGVTTTLATDLEAPEGVVWASDDTLYVTESNLQFVTDPRDLRTRIAAVSPSGVVTRVITSTPTIRGTDVTFWSYAGLAIDPDGLLYVTNEISGREITRTVVVIPNALTLTFSLSTTDSIFSVDPAAGDRTLFSRYLVSPEGLRFSATGEFPLYVAEEDVGGGAGRLSWVVPDGNQAPLCTGFLTLEDVAVDRRGWLYVSEDASGLIILIKPTARYGLTATLATDAGSGDPGATVTYTLQVTNTGDVSDTFDVAASRHTWPTTAPASVGPLVAGDGTTVDVTVDIPPSAAGGITDTATITVASQGDSSQVATVTLTTTASVVWGVTVGSATGSQSGDPGVTVTYTLQVINTGNVSDTFDVAVSGNIWPTTTPAPVGLLAAGASANVIVTVSIPAAATGAETDAATITITSRGDNAKWTAVTLTTSARYALFLPLIVAHTGDGPPGVGSRGCVHEPHLRVVGQIGPGAWGLLLPGVLPGRGLGASQVRRMEVCATAAVGL
jgi:glucose/arabinose dehydrogenase